LAIPRSTLQAWIWMVTHDAQSVEDLSQDVYEQLLNLPESKIAMIGSVQAFARVVCRNRAADWLRAHHRRRRLLEYTDTCDVYPDSKCPEVILRTREWHEEVRSAVDSLPERQRKVLVLNRMYGITATEIAMQMGVKVNTVRRLLYDATLSLHKLLNQEEAARELSSLQQMTGAKE